MRAIIDCLEIFTEVPSSLTLHKAMYSTYKAHTTVKCLVAIAPGGGFSFVSALFPGNTSDKEMVARSGLLDQRLWEQEDALLLKFETSQKPPKTTQTSQKPPKNHRKPAKNQANHPESQSTNSKNVKIHEGRFTQGVYKTKTYDQGPKIYDPNSTICGLTFAE